jgi:hypothetical protein
MMQIKPKFIWSFVWRIGLFVLGIMIMGIVIQLIMPTIYVMTFEEEMIWKEWYWVAVYSPIAVLGLMLYWTYRSTVRLNPQC